MTKPEITYSISTSGTYYLTTALALSGRGIAKSGDNTYRCTKKAMEKILQTYSATEVAHP